jgi:hypothetical protein
MRRSASEVIRNLEVRIARLERKASRDEIDYQVRLELIDRLEEEFEDELDEDDELDAEWITVEDKAQKLGDTYILANVQNLYWGIIKIDSRNRSTIEDVSADSRSLKALMKRLKM